MQFHPIADVFPLIEGDEFQELAEDIRLRGLLEPIWLYDEAILDGRNRYRACLAASVEPHYRTYSGDDPIGFVVSLNLKRRHMDASQRAMVAARLATLPVGANQHTAIAAPSQSEAARLLNVSEDSIQRARKVHEQAAPELIAAVEKGDVAVSTAATLTELPQTEQAEIVLLGDAEILARAREIKAARRERLQREQREKIIALSPQYHSREVRIVQADCMALIGDLENNSVGLVLTDPPYHVTDNDWDNQWSSPKAYWDWMREWLRLLRPKMAEEFTAFFFCDAGATVEMHNVLVETGWPILRQVIWHRPNLAKKRSGSLTFLSSYEPFWHCGTRPLLFPETWGDERFDVQRFTVPQSTHVEDPSVHPTQKPLALFRRLVEIGAASGDLVFDPFSGAGTTALASHLEGRPCLAGDISEEYMAIAKGRLANAG